MKFSIALCALLIIFSIGAFPDRWIEEFKSKDIPADWKITDRPGNPSKFEVRDGTLRITCSVNFGHTEPDRPHALISAPEDDFVAEGLFSSDPEKPSDAWHGIFVISEDPLDYACLLFGGESNQPQKTLIGSMVKGTWQDKGHFPTGFDVPLYLRLEKKKSLWTGYTKKAEGDDWTVIGAPWTHDFRPKWVGVGFINNWGGKTVTLITDWFAVEGPKVVSNLAVESKDKLATAWGRIKLSN